MKKIKNGTKVANVFVGEVDFLDDTHDELVVFMRLGKPVVLDITEVVLPTKFVFIYLSKFLVIFDIYSFIFSLFRSGNN